MGIKRSVEGLLDDLYYQIEAGIGNPIETKKYPSYRSRGWGINVRRTINDLLVTGALVLGSYLGARVIYNTVTPDIQPADRPTAVAITPSSVPKIGLVQTVAPQPAETSEPSFIPKPVPTAPTTIRPDYPYYQDVFTVLNTATVNQGEKHAFYSIITGGRMDAQPLLPSERGCKDPEFELVSRLPKRLLLGEIPVLVDVRGDVVYLNGTPVHSLTGKNDVGYEDLQNITKGHYDRGVFDSLYFLYAFGSNDSNPDHTKNYCIPNTALFNKPMYTHRGR